MDGDRDRLGVGAALLAVAAVGLCCGAPLLILAGGAIVAVVGWTYLGIGVGAVVLAVTATVALYRYRQAVGRKNLPPNPQLDSIRKES